MSETAKRTSGASTTAATSPAMPAQQALAAFEAKQLTRRAALAKLGIRSAAAVLAAFSIDDLARKVGQAMEQRTTNNQVAGAVAKEFQAAGLAFADPANPPNPSCGWPTELCAGTFFSYCGQNLYNGTSNRVECCQVLCQKNCEPATGEIISPCGGSLNEVQGKITVCQNHCAALAGSGV